MIRLTLFILLICGVSAYAEGPLFRHKETEKQQEFENAYKDIRAAKSKIVGLIVNVKDYGAKGDGTMDDSSSISGALSAVSGNCGIVYFPYGIYGVTLTNTVGCQTLMGNGNGGTKLKRLSGTNTILILTGSGTITGLTLDGNSLAGEALILEGSNHGKVDHVNFVNIVSTNALEIRDSFNATMDNLEWHNPFSANDFYLINSYYSDFSHLQSFGFHTNYGIKIDTSATTISFYDLYMESPFDYNAPSLRDIIVKKLRMRIDAMNDAFIRSRNVTGGAGSECAQIKFEDVSITQNVSISSIPIIDVNNYQLTMNTIHIYDGSSPSGTIVVRDEGTNNFIMENWTLEMGTNWNLLDPVYDLGTFFHMKNVNYTQGSTGTVVLPNQHKPGGTGLSGYTSVEDSNLNFSISTATNLGGFSFSQILGSIDVTNSIGPVFIFNSSGPVTDPNCAVIGCVVSSFTTAGASIPGSGAFYAVGSTCTVFLNAPGSYDLSAIASWDSNGTTFTSTRYDLVIDSSPSASHRVLGFNQLEDIAVSTISVSQKTLNLSGYPVTLTAGTSFYAVGLVSAFTGNKPIVYGGIRAKRTQ